MTETPAPSTSKPIGDFAMLADCKTAALVGLDGSVDWWCAPRFDSPALFAALLDPEAGFCRLAPSDATATSRRAYVKGTLVLETTFETPTGEVVVTDALALGPKETGHEIGFNSPGVLLRSVRCTRGRVAMTLRVAARPEYGAIEPVASLTRRGATLRGGAERIVVSSSKKLALDGPDVVAEFVLHRGGRAFFSIARSGSSVPTPDTETPRSIRRMLRGAIRGWQVWSEEHQSYEGSYREVVHRNGIVLQALTYQPTGALVAAITTSLPESAGGDLNWDYRYSWLRDASMTLDALWVAACPDEAERYFRWLANAGGSRTRERSLQIVYGVGGEHDLSERELPHLRGYRDSRPVRVGNAAWQQDQNDVYGSIVGAARRFSDQLDGFDRRTHDFIAATVEDAISCWQEPDSGLWEKREEKRRFVHSAAMCWCAVDGGIAIAKALGAEDRVERWSAVREEMAETIRARGWSEKKNAYVQSFEDDDTLDAAVLVLVTRGFCAPDDPRARATVETIARELADERGLIRRYLEGEEASFSLCTFWLAEAQAVIGDLDLARATFDRAASYANDVGLMSEEVETKSGDLLGNFPQGFSHLGLINAAWAIDSRTPRGQGTASAKPSSRSS